ncbi:transposase orfA, ISSmu1 [Streptococcus pneumoniae]|nr:transposase orfA, ISSmu1 [Streptococcus pneumoniae]SNM68758.1 transposase orfA, ISSmu1 [Streptococcus pneumoniae]
MKLTYDDKVQIYELMIKLIDRYGIEFVKKGKNRYYSPDLKQEMIHKV